MFIINLLFLFASWLSYTWLFILCRVWEWHVDWLAWCIWLPTAISLKRKSSVSCGRGLPCPIGNFALTEPLPEDIRSLLSMHTVPFLLPFCSPFILFYYYYNYFVNPCIRSAGTAVVVFTAWSGQFYIHPTLWDVCVCD